MRKTTVETANETNLWSVGASRVPLPTGALGRRMMGWAQPRHVAEGAAMPLFARAMVLGDGRGSAAAVVLIDYSSVSRVLRDAVVAKLGLGSAAHLAGPGLLLTATHTHSGPGGYLDGPLFRVVNPYDPDLVDNAAAAIAHAVEQAWAARQPARLRLGADTIALTEPVAFNRSLDAHNANAENRGRQPLSADEATDRTQTVLWAESIASEQPLAALCVFATHGTCVHADCSLIHPDHKGIAAVRFEDEWRMRGATNFVAMFAQGSAGDITPNFRPNPSRGFTVTAWDNDYEGAEQVAAIQVRSARNAMRQSPVYLRAKIGRAWTWVDFSCSAVSPDFAGGIVGRRTGPGVLGLGMMMGTAEGPGPLRSVRASLQTITKLRERIAAKSHPDGSGASYLATHGGKLPGLDMAPPRHGKAVGKIPVPWFRRVPHVDGFAKGIRRVLHEASESDLWLDPVLPLQILIFGSLAIVALPFEPTTQAGKRVRSDVQRALARRGVTGAIVIGYANDYGGYITTPEEYALQEYEGGFTLFGRWSLDAIRTAIQALCDVVS